MADENYTQPQHIVDVWRPLGADEQTRAQGLIAQVERLLVARWPDIDMWIASRRLDRDTLADVVTWLVLPQLGTGVDLPVNTRSYQNTGGTESQQVTLADTAAGAFFTLSPWMVDIFDRLARADRPEETTGKGGPVFGGGTPPRVRSQFPTWPYWPGSGW